MRAMSWQNLDANANRQGVTIAEFGELGGPGFGGCPAAAAQTGPASPTAVTATDNGNGGITVNWTKPTATPGTSPVIGYTVRAVSQTSTGGGQDEVGKRLSDPAATTATLGTALAGKTVEVRSLTAAGESWPPAVANKGTGTGTGTTDTTLPTVTAAPAGGSFAADVNVKLTASEPGNIWYSVDGSDPLVANDAGLTSEPYDPATGIVIAAKDTTGAFVTPVTLRYVAFDGANNPSLAKTEVYTFGNAAAPGAPANVKAVASNTTVDVTWTAPAVVAGSSPITGYKITATAPGAATPAASTTVLASATTATLTGLANGTAYTVSVIATSAAGDGPAGTATTTATPTATEILTATAPTNKANDFRVRGTSDATTGGVSLYRTDAAGNQSGTALATSTLAAAAAPATGHRHDLRPACPHHHRGRDEADHRRDQRREAHDHRVISR